METNLRQQRMGKDKKLKDDGGKKHKCKQSHNDKNPKKALKPNKSNQKHQQINNKNKNKNINDRSNNINNSSRNNITSSSSTITPTNTTKKGLSALQTKFAKKLQGSRFRIINESIYTRPGADSFTGQLTYYNNS